MICQVIKMYSQLINQMYDDMIKSVESMDGSKIFLNNSGNDATLTMQDNKQDKIPIQGCGEFPKANKEHQQHFNCTISGCILQHEGIILLNVFRLYPSGKIQKNPQLLHIVKSSSKLKKLSSNFPLKYTVLLLYCPRLQTRLKVGWEKFVCVAHDHLYIYVFLSITTWTFI